MSDEAALLKAIIAHPDDDTPRLVYADWLDENVPDAIPSPAAGPSAYAEYIRVQCRLARRPHDDPDYAELLERERDLGAWLKTHDKARVDEVPGLPEDLIWLGGDDIDEWPTCHRGFPEEAEFLEYTDDVAETVDIIAAALEAAFANTTVRTLRMEDALGAEIAGLATEPVVAGLRGLYLDYISDDEVTTAVRGLATSPHLTGLRRLFFDFDLAKHEARLLAKSTNFGSLETLVLNDPLTDGVKPFASARWFRELRSLKLWQDSSDGMKSVAALSRMPNLVSLTLRGSVAVSASTLRKFASSASWPNLRHLEFENTRLSPELIAILARGPWPLRRLQLNGVSVRKGGAEALAEAAYAPTLQVLELPGCEITAGGVQALANSPALAGLKHLDLSSNPIGPGGLAALARSQHLRGLRSLRLDNIQHYKAMIDTRAAQSFLASLDMPELRHLDLTRLPIGVRGARTIAAGGSFANLTRLNLAECGISENGAKAIAESASLGNLVVLDLRGNRAGTGVSPLADPKVLPRLAECNLYHNRLSKWTLSRVRKRPGVLT